jgi:hypothetical protein
MYRKAFALLQKHKRYHIPTFLAASTIALTAFYIAPHQPLFITLDSFVLFADEGVTLEENTQVSSGDIGANSGITFHKNVLVTGNLFADKITLDKGVSVNGNVAYNKLKSATSTQILGTQTKPVQLPIANLLILADFTIGTTSLTITGTSTIISPNNYRDITLSNGSTLVLQSGTYTLRSLELKEGSTLTFTGTTILNIQRALKGEKRVSILPGLHTHHDQLTINYNGFKEKNFKTRDRFDDDKDVSDAFDNDGERKDWQKGISAQPITFGERAFLNFKLIAPRASVTIGRESIIRGQVVAGKIRISKNSILGRNETFIKKSDIRKVFTNNDGGRFPINEIVVNFSADATIEDVMILAQLITGRITAFVPSANVYKFEVSATTVTQLDQVVNQIKSLHDPKIEGVVKNYLLNKL